VAHLQAQRSLQAAQCGPRRRCRKIRVM
jgi:hypothetical protein